jgi:hypothetical protein
MFLSPALLAELLPNCLPGWWQAGPAQAPVVDLFLFKKGYGALREGWIEAFREEDVYCRSGGIAASVQELKRGQRLVCTMRCVYNL